MSKIIREQMQAVEADRAAQKSKRKDYSDAAVDILLDRLVSLELLFRRFSGHNFVQKKKKNSRNIKINYANKTNKNVY